jgi:hypothetical protein
MAGVEAEDSSRCESDRYGADQGHKKNADVSGEGRAIQRLGDYTAEWVTSG